jgi:ankyrin repeat protein/truncated hemoglobin YjbI
MTELQSLLRHRGGLQPSRPEPGLLQALGGRAGVAELAGDLYQRIAADPFLCTAFPDCFSPFGITQFLVEWFGGERVFSDTLDGGLVRAHQHRYVSPRGAAAWLECMRQALEARGMDPQPVLRLLGPIAHGLVHSPEVEPAQLDREHGVREPAAVRLEALLADAARGRAETVQQAVQQDATLATRPGKQGRTLLWVAVERNRPELAALALASGADPDRPACNGSFVMLTPLALARKRRPGLVALLRDHGARDDIFTAAWLGEREEVAASLDAHPALLNAIDPADDFQEVTPLAHAVAGGDAGTVALLLARGAEVARHSGKLLALAIEAERPDLVEALLRHGAEAHRASSLGPLDGDTRPIADLLVAHGKTVSSYMFTRACRADVSRNEVHRVGVLLGYGADVNGVGQYGLTALHYAVRSGKIDLIRLLLERGADVKALDDEGLTPLLHLTRTRAKHDPLAVLELMVAHGADVNAPDNRGQTLLSFYRHRRRQSVVNWLIDHGASAGGPSS